ncbi:src kinase-associated phosphoprotein 2-B-like [Ptychodera flava]|uniref:src kinase-associated phosphoprotein 2-B-like n=1 Tax=Ptychodera flava TaxID=63121 RepID=UPI00396AB013
MDSIIADVKNVMKDVENFLTSVLKKEKLSRDATKKKDELITKVSNLRTKMATDDEEQTRSAMKTNDIIPEEEEYADVDVQEPEKVVDNKIEDEEIYEEPGLVEPEPKNGSSHADTESIDDGVYDDAKMITGPVAANDLLSPRKSGYLDKKRKEGQIGIGKWQNRWCVIKDTYFYYYSKPSDKKQKNVINILGYTAKPAPNIPDKKNKKKDFCFEITHPDKRDFQFIAVSTQDMNQWIEAVNKAGNSSETAHEPVQPIEEDDGDVYDDVSAPPEGSSTAVQPIPEEKPVVAQPNKSALFTEILPKQEAETVKSTTVSVMQCSNWEYDYNNIYVAMWDCKSSKNDELNFKRGEFIHLINALEEFEDYKWWIGETKEKVGFFPKEYVMKAYDLES